MRLTIEIKRPHCHSLNITRNGKKRGGKQNYRRAQRGRQFTGGHKLSCRGRLSRVAQTVKIILVRGIDIRDISATPQTSVAKVLKVLESIKYQIKPRQTHYDRLETDEFWTYVKKKKSNAWLIYACHREIGKIVAFVWGEEVPKDGAKAEEKDTTAGGKP